MRFWFNFILIRFNNRCTGKNGNFGVLVKMVLLMIIYNNICISGVFGWDYNLIISKGFVTCVHQLNTMFVFI